MVIHRYVSGHWPLFLRRQFALEEICINGEFRGPPPGVGGLPALRRLKAQPEDVARLLEEHHTLTEIWFLSPATSLAVRTLGDMHLARLAQTRSLLTHLRIGVPDLLPIFSAIPDMLLTLQHLVLDEDLSWSAFTLETPDVLYLWESPLQKLAVILDTRFEYLESVFLVFNSRRESRIGNERRFLKLSDARCFATAKKGYAVCKRWDLQGIRFYPLSSKIHLFPSRIRSSTSGLSSVPRFAIPATRGPLPGFKTHRNLSKRGKTPSQFSGGVQFPTAPGPKSQFQLQTLGSTQFLRTLDYNLGALGYDSNEYCMIFTTFGLNALSGRMDPRSELRDLSRSACVGAGPNAPAKMRGWEVYHGWVRGKIAEERAVGRSHTYSNSFWNERHRGFGTGIWALKLTRRHELVGTPKGPRTEDSSYAMQFDNQVIEVNQLKFALQLAGADAKHECPPATQLAENFPEPDGQTGIRARHNMPQKKASLFFDCLATKIRHAELFPVLKIKSLHPLIFAPPLPSCAHYRSMQATPTPPRPRRSLLPRKIPIRSNDDAAEKRLRRQVALELERSKEERSVAPAPEAEESEEMKELAASIQRYLDDENDSRDSSLNSVKDSAGGTGLANREHQDSPEEQAARNWEIWVRCVLERMNWLDREQLLRDWRDQEERERRWEAGREYADDLPSRAAHYVE
ncbi:hypothetical protein R3P38DRAFT_3193777 [Favolaschia claudopus]|uniref:Uncharacterized protein n=1 Tax=Favolaschia claudopus TaxID=2862362 RepID=A0AAW0BE18_9AGAR